VGVAGLVAYQGLFRPIPAQQPLVLGTFLGLSAVATGAGLLLPRLASRLDSVRNGVLLAAAVAMATSGAALAVATSVLMLGGAETQVLLTLLAFGTALGLVLELMVARSLAGDLSSLMRAAHRIARGDLEARTGLDRSDEIGRAARAIDWMAVELHAMERERERAVEARVAFLAAISHDLRTPLTALQAAVEVIEDRLVEDPERYWAAIHRDLDAMRGMVDNFFMLARMEGQLGFPKTPVDLSELADEAIEALAPVARQRGISFEFRRHSEAIVVAGPDELSRAVRNLLDNAIRHAPPQSRIVVEVAGAPAATLRIVDEGPGFSEELRERFVAASLSGGAIMPRAPGGTGLGLLIAKGVAEAHGGRLTLQPGPGGNVSLEVPLRPDRV
jgi:signal transduction histidine kinase